MPKGKSKILSTGVCQKHILDKRITWSAAKPGEVEFGGTKIITRVREGAAAAAPSKASSFLSV